MGKIGFTAVACACALVISAGAQEKPRVFVQGKGSQDVTSSGSGVGGKHWASWGAKSSIDSHDESIEVTKNLQKDCAGVTVTLNPSNADYTLMLNRESKHNRGLLRTNSQVQVANRQGDVLGTSATHTVGNAAKDACQMILADWQAHGRLNVQESQTQATPSAAPAAAAAVQPATAQTETTRPAGAHLQAVSATSDGAGQTQTTAPANEVVVSGGDSLGDSARKQKQRKACLELAKDNPSIVCK